MLDNLNEDVFGYILSQLTVRDMLAFSSTCRWIRQACMPLLFHHCYYIVYSPQQFMDPELFLSASLRPYIQ